MEVDNHKERRLRYAKESLESYGVAVGVGVETILYSLYMAAYDEGYRDGARVVARDVRDGQASQP